jgi:hypothetical protein
LLPHSDKSPLYSVEYEDNALSGVAEAGSCFQEIDIGIVVVDMHILSPGGCFVFQTGREYRADQTQYAPSYVIRNRLRAVWSLNRHQCALST